MATPQQLGTLDTLSAPRFHQGMIWFQGKDDKLMVMPMDDPSKAFNVGGLETQSEPVPVANRYMCFRGEGDKLMVVTTDPPYLHGQLGSAKCVSAPVPSGPYLYFEGGKTSWRTGNALWRCRYDRDELQPVGANDRQIFDCMGPPAVDGRNQLIYSVVQERPENEKLPGGGILRPADLDVIALRGVNVAIHRRAFAMPGKVSNLYTDRDGSFWCILYTQLTMVPFPRWKTKNLVAYADPIRPCMAPYGSDNFIYYVFSHDLYRIPKTTTKTDAGRELLARGCATSPDVQPGFVIYGGTDKKIYKLAL